MLIGRCRSAGPVDGPDDNRRIEPADTPGQHQCGADLRGAGGTEDEVDGVVRRHHFGGGPKAHGHMFQVQGSIGASSFPSRVFPGQRMPGHYGAEQVTVRNLRIRGIDLDENLLMVEGAIPGPRDGYVMISKSKAPPRERRGFAGSGTVDPLKASKKATAKRK